MRIIFATIGMGGTIFIFSVVIYNLFCGFVYWVKLQSLGNIDHLEKIKILLREQDIKENLKNMKKERNGRQPKK